MAASKRKSWYIGIILLLAGAGLLWYFVISFTDIAQVGKTTQSEAKLERPEVPSVSLPPLEELGQEESRQSLPPE